MEAGEKQTALARVGNWFDRLDSHPGAKKFLRGIYAASAGLFAVALINTLANDPVPEQELAIVCSPEECSPSTALEPTTSTIELQTIEPTSTVVLKELPPPDPVVLTPETTAPPATMPPQPVVAAASSAPVPLEVINSLNPEVKARMDAMNLTLGGYILAINSIDTSFLEYAQTKHTFNPAGVPIPQNPTEFFTSHFSVNVFYGDGVNLPTDQMDVKALIDFMYERFGTEETCCGVNWMIDDYGKIYMTTPYGAKVRHNKDFEGKTTGAEIHAATLLDIKTVQYEALAYIAIADLIKANRLKGFNLADVMKGHGEASDELRDPSYRNDFDKPESAYHRSKVETLLSENPEIYDIPIPF